MKTGQLRTNLFHFDPAKLPNAHQYPSTERYRNAWRLLEDIWDRHDRYKIPTTLLAEMVSVLSHGPAWVNSDPNRDKSQPAIVTLQPVDLELINQVLHLWALELLHRSSSTEPAVPDNLLVDTCTPLHAEDLICDGASMSSLAYEIVPWLVSSSMAATHMASSVPLPLHMTSEGSLLAWDNPIVAESGPRQAMALHSIRPALVLLRGETSPLISIRVHISHILREWKHRTRNVWLRTNGGISKLAVYTKRNIDGTYETLYSNPTDRLLGYMGIDGFPKLGTGDLTATGDLRPIHAVTPSTPLIASGPGPLFLDQACWHLLRSIDGIKPVLADRAIYKLKKAVPMGADDSVGTEPVLALTAHARTTVRLDAANRMLAAEGNAFKGVPLPPLSLHHFTPDGAERALCEPVTGSSLEEWFRSTVVPEIQTTRPGTALVETSMAVAKAKADLDPKFQLRKLFAKHGVTTQFIFDAEIKGTDYAAKASLLEVVRQSGALPVPAPKVATLPEDTVVVSVYVDRIKAKGGAVFLPVVTRTRLDGSAPEIFWLDAEQETMRWFDYRTGTARIHAAAHLFNADAVRKLVTQALLAPTPIADTPLIVYLHSGLRSIYDGLKDSGGLELPGIANKGAWIVRIRADNDVAQMSGDNSNHPNEPAYIGHKVGLYRAQSGKGLYYFVSPSNQYGRVISQRTNTRFDVRGRSLRDPWQQLGVTEIAIIRTGDFADDIDIAHQTALLCRSAPTWDGNLRLPSPMHMAKQLTEDHPDIEINRRVHGSD